jgi:hypothetical protein
MKFLLIIILGSLGGISLLAQQTVSSAGKEGNGTGGAVSYTIGQVAYTTITDGVNGSVAQGVQQPYEISVVTALEEANDISLEFSVYPNPAKDYLILKIEGEVKTQCIASLYNINGNLLQTIKVESNVTTISMQSNLPGTYILKITRANKEIKTFKIIKH